MQLEKIRAAAERVAASEGLEVVEVEWKIGKQRFLRVTIDKLEGVGHLDCERVSNQLSVILDVEELVSGGSYILEVSSPGLDRKLLKESDYQRFAGRKAKIWLFEPVESKNYWEGRLGGISGGVVSLELKDRSLTFPFAAIRKAQLVVEF
jgi:ribosome maturation factor RimP